MTRIFELQNDQWIIIYSREEKLILQYKEGDRIGRPFLLAQDYRDQFSGAVYQNTVYYIYRNTQSEWVLKNVRDSVIYYRFGTAREDIFQVTVTDDGLNLWHIGHRQNSGEAFLERIKMFEGPAQMLIERFPEGSVRLIPGVAGDVGTGQTDGMIVVTGMEEDSCGAIYRVDKNGNTERFTSESSRWQNVEKDRAEREKDEKEREERSAIELGSLREMLKAREAENEKLREMLDKREAEAAQLQAMISSATNQYNELMHVAEQYRDEAIKWRSKFTF